MSLMNDALRKKKRETTVSPVAQGFIDVSHRPRITRRWLAALAGLSLLTIAVFSGNHMIQSSNGDSLLAITPQPGRSRPPANPPADTTSEVRNRSDGEPLPASADRQTEILTSEDPPKKDRLATAVVNPAPPSLAVSVKRPDTRAGELVPAIQPADQKPAVPASAKTALSIEVPVEPAQGEPNAVPRTFEPGPVQTDRREKSRSVVPRQPRLSAQPVPSPGTGQASETIGKLNAGAAVRKNAPSGGEEDLFYKKARTYHRNGRLADAIRLYRQVLKAHSSHPGAMLNLAAAYMQQGNYIEAAPLLNRLERSNPRPQGVLLNLAMAAIGMGSPEKALDYLDQATALSDATPWEIRFHRAVVFARMNRLPEALALYREAERERPEDPRLQFNLAVTCDTLGLYPKAVSHYEAVLRGPSESSETDKATITQRIRTLRRYLGNAQSPATGQ